MKLFSIFALIKLNKDNKMNYIKLIFLFIISIFMFSACSTDIDVNGDWEDLPIVYCVLDQSSEYQYVKINKTFLGQMPASEMAQVSDSLFYEEVTVIVKEYVDNSFRNSWTFTPVDTINKPAGYFAHDRNTIYIAKFNLNEDAEYEIEVNINNGEHIVTGSTKLISGLGILTPSSYAPQIEIASYVSDFEYKYYNGENSKVYQMTIVFNYLEVMGADTVEKSIIWPQNKEFRTHSIASNVIGKFSNLAFYNLLTATIPEAEDGMVRLVKMPESIGFILSAADENYATYMEITSPSNGIVQEKPSFTNLLGGFGLFASRNSIFMYKKLGGRTIDSISRGIYTYNLGFVDKYDTYYLNY